MTSKRNASAQRVRLALLLIGGGVGCATATVMALYRFSRAETLAGAIMATAITFLLLLMEEEGD